MTGPIDVPAWVGSRPTMGSRPTTLIADGVQIAQVGSTPRLVQGRMVKQAAACADELMSIGDDDWFALLARASATVEEGLRAGHYDAALHAYAQSTGIPVRRAWRGVSALVGQLSDLGPVLAEQSPDGSQSAYRTGDVGRAWSWRPAGRTAMVRVPSNFPTIAIEWLQVLAMRRPVLVSTTAADPFIAGIFAEALYSAGLPDGAVQVSHDATEAWANLAEQVVWPGEQVPPGLEPTRLKMYHYGRSKAAVFAEPSDAEWDRLVRLAFQGCGRLCTNVSAVLTTGDAEQHAARLASSFRDHPVRPLHDPLADVPAFTDPAALAYVDSLVRTEIAAGARDMTAEAGAGPLRVDAGGKQFLRPTVLLVDPDSSLLRQELPFPFVTVAAATRESMAYACRRSLIVSVVGGTASDHAALADEPSITKVFGGSFVDRGYVPADPQEGYLADFLFQKKALYGLA